MQLLVLLTALLFFEKTRYFRPPTDFPPRSCLLQVNLSRFFNHSSYGVLRALPRNPPLFWVFSKPSLQAFQERRVVAALILVLCSWSGDTFCLGGRCWSAREGKLSSPQLSVSLLSVLQSRQHVFGSKLTGHTALPFACIVLLALKVPDVGIPYFLAR